MVSRSILSDVDMAGGVGLLLVRLPGSPHTTLPLLN